MSALPDKFDKTSPTCFASDHTGDAVIGRALALVLRTEPKRLGEILHLHPLARREAVETLDGEDTACEPAHITLPGGAAMGPRKLRVTTTATPHKHPRLSTGAYEPHRSPQYRPACPMSGRLEA